MIDDGSWMDELGTVGLMAVADGRRSRPSRWTGTEPFVVSAFLTLLVLALVLAFTSPEGPAAARVAATAVAGDSAVE